MTSSPSSPLLQLPFDLKTTIVREYLHEEQDFEKAFEYLGFRDFVKFAKQIIDNLRLLFGTIKESKEYFDTNIATIISKTDPGQPQSLELISSLFSKLQTISSLYFGSRGNKLYKATMHKHSLENAYFQIHSWLEKQKEQDQHLLDLFIPIPVTTLFDFSALKTQFFVQISPHRQAMSIRWFLIKNKDNVETVKIMTFNDRNLRSLPDEVGLFVNIQTLELRLNRLSDIPKVVFQLTHLIKLDLSENQIDQLPDEEWPLSRLQVLALNNNQIANIPIAVFQLPKLNTLDLSTNQITNLPNEEFRSTKLTTLYLYYNEIERIPKGFSDLSNLETLVLKNNRFTHIPPAIGKLTTLHTLDLSSNEITEIPDDLTQLKELHLSDNQVSVIPKKLSQLITLVLNNNQLLHIPKKLRQLKALYLRNNDVRFIPKAIGRLVNLVAICLSHNQIERIPSSIGLLTKLEALHLSHNRIKKIPKEFSNLTTLICLKLAYNQLREVSITPWPALVLLNLSGNRITHIPPPLRELNDLRIDDNPLEE